jgi:hypothetical protein
MRRREKEIIDADGLTAILKNNRICHLAMGLYFYNPLSSRKLIYWVAADSLDAYHPYHFLFQLQDSPCGIDFLVVQENPVKIIKVRHFDSRWNWSNALKNSAIIPEKEIGFGDVFRNMAESIKTVTASDFALMAVQVPGQLQAGIPGIIQWADIASLDPTVPVAVFDMKGSLILSHQKGFLDGGTQVRFFPPADKNTDPDRIYRVALLASGDLIRQLVNLQKHVPDSFSITDFTLF